MSEPEVAVFSAEAVERRRSLADRFDRAPVHREVRHAVKYGIVGVINVTLDFALYALLVSVGVWYPLAKTASLTVATANGYTLNRIWTFRAGPHRNLVLTKYVTVQASCLAGNIALLVPLVEIAGMNKVSAQAIVIPIIALSSFIGQRVWTFGAAMSQVEGRPDGRGVVRDVNAHRRPGGLGRA
jgi:putative flippase GtrA